MGNRELGELDILLILGCMYIHSYIELDRCLVPKWRLAHIVLGTVCDSNDLNRIVMRSLTFSIYIRVQYYSALCTATIGWLLRAWLVCTDFKINFVCLSGSRYCSMYGPKSRGMKLCTPPT